MFTAIKWVATTTSISCFLVSSGQDGGNSSPFSIGPSGICLYVLSKEKYIFMYRVVFLVHS